MKAEALLGFHALSGADNTGCFSGKGKPSWWKVFDQSNDDVLNAFVNLMSCIPISDSNISKIDQFVCKLYSPSTKSNSIADLRWWMFHKKNCQSEKLPPTMDALEQAIKRAQHQANIWANAIIANPEALNPESFGWKIIDNLFHPVMSTLPPAPEAIVELIKCGCLKSKCESARCKCVANKLSCCELCSCYRDEDEEICCNRTSTSESETSSDSEDE